MSTFSSPSPHRRVQRRRRGRLVPLLAGIAALALAFLLGVAFSRALDERPVPGVDATTVRTVSLLPDEATHTVTVTVTSP